MLNLAGNSLTGALPAEWGHLSNLERLDLSRNSGWTLQQPAGALPAEWGWLDHLMELALSHNSLAGPLPQSLTGLKALEQFYFDNTELCAPRDRVFQDWLRGIDDVRGASCPPDATEQEPEQPDRAAVASPASEAAQHAATPSELAALRAELQSAIGKLKAELEHWSCGCYAARSLIVVTPRRIRAGPTCGRGHARRRQSGPAIPIPG